MTVKNAKKAEPKTTTPEKTVERIPLQGTPFMAVRWDSEWMLMLGDYVLLRGLPNAASVEHALETEKWHIIGALVYSLVDNIKKNETKTN